MNIRLFVVLFVSLFGFGHLFAQEQDFDRSVCWEIRKPGVTVPSYVFGSIHQMDTSKIHFPIDTLCSLIDRCQSVCFEVVTQDSTAQMNELMNKLFLSETEKNIVNSLEKEQLERLYQIIDSSKYFLLYFKPILNTVNPTVLCFLMEAEKQLSTSKLVTKATFQPETHFLNYAKSKDYSIHQLETFQQQTDFILQPDLKFDEAMEELKATITDYNKPDTIDIFQKYIDQDLSLLEREAFSDSSVVKRNYIMADGIDLLVSKSPVFVMVGAAHLPYENGVLHLLVEKGYVVKPYFIEFSK